MNTLNVKRSGNSAVVVEVLFPYNTNKYTRFYISAGENVFKTSVTYPALISFRQYESLPPRLVARAIEPLTSVNTFAGVTVELDLSIDETENKRVIESFVASNSLLQKYTLNEFDNIYKIHPLIPELAKKHPVCWKVNVAGHEVFFPYWAITLRSSRPVKKEFYDEFVAFKAAAPIDANDLCHFVSKSISRHYRYVSDEMFSKSKDYVGSDDKFAVGDCEDFASAAMRMIKSLSDEKVTMLSGMTPYGFHMWCCLKESNGKRHFVDGTGIRSYSYITHEYSELGSSLLMTGDCYGVSAADYLNGNYTVKHFLVSDSMKVLLEHTLKLDIEPINPIIACM